jgi:hypothetical protein
MQRWIYQLLVIFSLAIYACDETIEPSDYDLEEDYQPLAVGNFWIYRVDETIHFGENDSETKQYFYRDLIRTTYLNAEKELTYVVTRSKSFDKEAWNLELEYTLIYRERTLLRTIHNVAVAALVFPPQVGRKWNGKAYLAEGDDEFEIVSATSSSIPGYEDVSAIHVSQEELDDKITVRDIRYEVFGKGVGLLEKYDETLTYCSRNDCLGDQLIDSGQKTHLVLIAHGSN